MTKISAQVRNGGGRHDVELWTNNVAHSITIPPKPNGAGSSANGGELLFLALATCFCNDIYREAAKRGIKVTEVEVVVDGEFGAEGEPAKNVGYYARVVADNASEDQIRELVTHTDMVAEVHNTLRVGTPVALRGVEPGPRPR